MPAKLSAISSVVANRAVEVGAQIRAYRKALGVSATTAAQAAGMSRVTWYRIEKGATTVTVGAYMSALAVLGLDLKIIQPSTYDHDSDNKSISAESIPVRIALSDYPQLKQLAWQVHGVDDLSPREALSIYERNWRHLDLKTMELHERNLVAALRQIFTGIATMFERPHHQRIAKTARTNSRINPLLRVWRNIVILLPICRSGFIREGFDLHAMAIFPYFGLCR